MSKEGKHGIIIKFFELSHEKLPHFIGCRPIFVQRFIEEAGFKVLNVTKMSLLNLPVEIVLAKKNKFSLLISIL